MLFLAKYLIGVSLAKLCDHIDRHRLVDGDFEKAHAHIEIFVPESKQSQTRRAKFLSSVNSRKIREDASPPTGNPA